MNIDMDTTPNNKDVTEKQVENLCTSFARRFRLSEQDR